IQLMLRPRPLPELEHLREFVSRVDVQNRKRHPTEERFPCQPDQHVRIFSHRPRHGDVLERVIRLAKNKNALVLEFVEMSAVRLGRHAGFSWPKLATDEHRFTQMISSSYLRFP